MAVLKDLLVTGDEKVLGKLSAPSGIEADKILQNDKIINIPVVQANDTIALKSDITTLQSNFQDGVDSICAEIDKQGGTAPTEKSLANTVSAISTIKTRWNPTQSTLSDTGVLSVKNEAGTQVYSTTFENTKNSAMVGDATAGNVLFGKTFTNSKTIGATGTMPDNSAITTFSSSGYSSGVYFRFPYGYYANKQNTNNDGMALLRVPADTLGDAVAANVLSGKTFTTDKGIKITGTMPNAESSITMTAGNGSITGTNVTLSDTNNGISVIGSGSVSATAKITTAGYAPTTLSATGSSTSSKTATKYITAITVPKDKPFSITTVADTALDETSTLSITHNAYRRISINAAGSSRTEVSSKGTTYWTAGTSTAGALYVDAYKADTDTATTRLKVAETGKWLVSNFGNATAGNVLSGKTFTSSAGLVVTGTMPNAAGSVTMTAGNGSITGTNVTLSDTDTSGISITGSGSVSATAKITTAGYTPTNNSFASGGSTSSNTATKYLTGITLNSGKTFDIYNDINEQMAIKYNSSTSSIDFVF